MNLIESINKIFPVLELIISEEDLISFRDTDKKELYLYHFSMGKWIRNNLLTENGKLYRLFIENNIVQKDNMSSKIIAMFHEYLSKKT